MKRNGLFAIDVASEIRSLCEAQLRGTWQMPAEFVRFAVRFGAARVEVGAGRTFFTLLWRGGRIERSTLEDLVVAFDESAEVAERQRSIARLETSGAEALLWGGGVPGARLTIDQVAEGKRLRLNRIEGRQPRLRLSDGSSLVDGVAIRWRCSKLDRRRAVMWLRTACRFGTAEVLINGQHVVRGFRGGLYRLTLDEPVPCTLALTSRGEEPVLWLMQEGVVAARATLPGYPPFEAAVELGGIARSAAGSADLRREVTPFVSELADRAVWMMIEVARQPEKLAGAVGQRLVVLLLRAVRRNLRSREIRALPLFRCPGGAERLLPLASVEALAGRRGGRLYAVDPDMRDGELLVDPGSAIVASLEVRGLLAELTGVRFQPPPRRRERVVRRVLDTARTAVRRTEERIQGALDSGSVPAEDLTAAERRLLAILQSVLSPKTVEMGKGVRLRRTASGFVLPRKHPAVLAAGILTADEPGWLYPLLLALQLGEPRSETLRNRWKSASLHASNPLMRQ
jgi:hypothetical protein